MREETFNKLLEGRSNEYVGQFFNDIFGEWSVVVREEHETVEEEGCYIMLSMGITLVKYYIGRTCYMAMASREALKKLQSLEAISAAHH